MDIIALYLNHNLPKGLQDKSAKQDSNIKGTPPAPSQFFPEILNPLNPPELDTIRIPNLHRKLHRTIVHNLPRALLGLLHCLSGLGNDLDTMSPEQRYQHRHKLHLGEFLAGTDAWAIGKGDVRALDGRDLLLRLVRRCGGLDPARRFPRKTVGAPILWQGLGCDAVAMDRGMWGYSQVTAFVYHGAGLAASALGHARNGAVDAECLILRRVSWNY